MAGFTNFFPDDTPDAVAGQSYSPGDLVFYNSNVYACTTAATLSNPIVSTDFDTNFALLSGGDAAVASAVDDLNSTDNLTFWSGTRAEYDALTPDNNTIYNIIDEPGVIGTFLGLEDTPRNYGNPGQAAIVNEAGDGLIFGDVASGGINPQITSVTFINDYTGNPTGPVTAAGTNHAPLNEVSYIEIAGNTFTALSDVNPEVTLTIGGMSVDLVETRVSNSVIRATIPAQGLTADPTTATITVTNALGGVSDPFTITFSAGPSLTSGGTFLAAVGGMVSVTITAVTNDGSTATFTAVSTLPSWLTLTDNRDNTATISGTVPEGTPEGTAPYIIRSTEGDGTHTDITVNIGAGTATFGVSLGTSAYMGPNEYARSASPTITTANYAMSIWFKLGAINFSSRRFIMNTFVDGGFLETGFGIESASNNDTLLIYARGGAFDTGIEMRDTSAWYHLAMKVTSGGIPEVWLNGEDITGTVNISNNGGTVRGDANGSIYVGTGIGSPTNDGPDSIYIANAIFVDGSNSFTGNFTNISHESFGEFSQEGYWQPVQYPIGEVGTNGFIMNFNDNIEANADSSTNGNSIQYAGTFDIVNDSPTDNYAGFDVASRADNTSSAGLNWTLTGTAGVRPQQDSTYNFPKSGKYYLEYQTNGGDLGGIGLYIGSPKSLQTSTSFGGWHTSGGAYGGILIRPSITNTVVAAYRPNGTGTIQQGSYIGVSVGSNTDVFGFAIDCDVTPPEIQVYNNGIAGQTYRLSWGRTGNAVRGSETINLPGDGSVIAYVPDGFGDPRDWLVIGLGNSGSRAGIATFNAGQLPFSASGNGTDAPSGFSPLSSSNLPDPITLNEHFANGAYRGNSGQNTVTSSLGFQPDLVMIKNTSSIGYGFFDVIRGGSSYITPSSNVAPTDFGSSGLTFDASGFTIGGESSTLNNSSFNYVYHAWRAGGTAVSNTDGTRTANVSANTDAGFSIIEIPADQAPSTNSQTFTYGHGLNEAPEIIITKSLTAASGNWWTSIDGITGVSGDYLALNQLSSVDNLSGSGFNFGNATDSVFTINGAFVTTNTICYAWHSVPGYSKFGTYYGNGSTDGPFINCGFKPAIVIIKGLTGVSGGGNWYMYTSELSENIHNPVDHWIRINETTGINDNGYHLDFLANGFKNIQSNADVNQNGARFMYMAFAESPFKYSLGR